MPKVRGLASTKQMTEALLPTQEDAQVDADNNEEPHERPLQLKRKKTDDVGKTQADDDETTLPPQKKKREEENQDEKPDKGTEEQPVQLKRKNKEDAGETQVDHDETTPPPQKKKTKSDPRGHAVANAYWFGISAESGVKVQTVRQVYNGIKKIATRDLEEIGSFAMLGIASFHVKDRKFRQAYTTTLNGKKISVSEKQPYKKLVVKSTLGLTSISD